MYLIICTRGKNIVTLHQKLHVMIASTKSEIISLLSDVNREGISSVISYLLIVKVSSHSCRNGSSKKEFNQIRL